MNSEVTLKNDVYAFATSRSRAKNSVRVCACQIPMAAKSEPSATSVTSSARGSQSASGARATTPNPATNGKTKNASAIAPARSSHVQRNDVAERVTNAASGSARRNGRRRRALAAEHPIREREHGGGEHEVERQEQERLLVADLDRDAERRDGEQRDGHHGRIADEQDARRATAQRAHADEGDARSAR